MSKKVIFDIYPYISVNIRFGSSKIEIQYDVEYGI